MSAGLTVALAIALLLTMLVLRVPVALALAGSGMVGLVLLRDWSIAWSAIAAEPFSAVASQSMIVVPMYIIMGMLAMHAGIAEDVFGVVNRYSHRLPGGLGVATIGACAGFAAVSGSSLATVASVGRLSLREMLRFGYDKAFAAGIVGSAGTLGVLIPPSIILVLYGIIAGESIGALLLGGMVPGVISAVAYIAFVVLRAWRNPSLVGRGPRDPGERSHLPGGRSDARGGGGRRSAGDGTTTQDTDVEAHAMMRAEAPAEGVTGRTEAPADVHAEEGVPDVPAGSMVGVAMLVLLFSIVIGGIYLGVFTATESGALGAVAALAMLVVQYRHRLREMLARVTEALQEAAAVTSTVFFLIVGASIFTYFFVLAGIPTAFTRTVTELDLPPYVILILLLIGMVPLGMFLDPISILLVVTPLVYPVVTALGFDGVWFGILMVKMIELGLITPPIGINAFVVAGASPQISTEDAFRGLLPFVLVDAAVIAVILAFPGVVTWLPRAAGL